MAFRSRYFGHLQGQKFFSSRHVSETQKDNLYNLTSLQNIFLYGILYTLIERTSHMRYFTGFLIVIGLIILVFVIILKGGGSTKAPNQINLNSYANSEAIAQLIIDGPITADQNHQTMEITVGRSESMIQLMQGYQGTVTSSQTFTNNQTSFAIFLHALNLVGFTQGNNSSSMRDERGHCATGDRYIFQLSDGDNIIERYWQTSCGSVGTYQGNVTSTIDLFEKQIPNFSTITSNFTY